MNKPLIIFVISALIVGIAFIPTFTQDFADAKSTKKIHFTKTLTSSQDPGLGHENHQLALVLAPKKGIIYDGSFTYAASTPEIQIVVLHEIDPTDSKGQPVWTVDGNTVYGLSLIDPGGTSGSFEFTGAALALHDPTTETFTATVSVDGWVRGGTVEIVDNKNNNLKPKERIPVVNLFEAHTPAKIPMHTGIFNEKQILYIITDSSDEILAEQISEKQEWIVNTSPVLSNATTAASTLGTIYFFTDGVYGNGLYGFQDEVFSSTPSQHDEYTALRKVVNVSWKPGQNSDVLHSVANITMAAKNGRIVLEETGIILNTPQIAWPDGQMKVRATNSTAHDIPYGGGQILDIDTESGIVTFVAHRGWGPDGRTIYYIVADATPVGTAEKIGVISVSSYTEFIFNSTQSDLFYFKNGIVGSGPLRFQPVIAASAPGDQSYSPIRRVSLVEWHDVDNDTPILETISDINLAKSTKKITTSIARPTNSIHITNSPFIDPFQNSKDKLSS